MATAASNVFGSCIFCKRCGTLFDLPGDEDYLTCDACGAQEDAQIYEKLVITTASNPNAFPSSLKQKKRSLVQHKDVDKTQVYVDEECEKCGYEKLAVKTMQLRSADEGATTFYTCEKCGHQTRLNN